MSTELQRIYEEIRGIEQSLLDNVSDLSAFRYLAAKSLLLAGASYFERRICDVILEHAKQKSVGQPLTAFIQGQALTRRYHQLFDWEKDNANKFFSTFGKEFRARAEIFAERDNMREPIKAFMSLGRIRNELVHENYANYNLDLTHDEVWMKILTALKFVSWLSELIDELDQALAAEQ